MPSCRRPSLAQWRSSVVRWFFLACRGPGFLEPARRPDPPAPPQCSPVAPSLASRRKPGSVIHDPAAVGARAVRMANDHTVVAIDGTIVPLDADTMCVHGDTPGSDDLAAKIRAGLEAAGVTVKAIGLT